MISISTSVSKNLAIVLLTVVLLYFGKSFLMPLAVGGILATLFLPLCKGIERKKVHRVLAAFICLLLLMVGIVGIVLLVGMEISKLTNDLVTIKQRAISLGNNVQEFLLSHLGISIEKQSQLLREEQPSLTFIVQRVGGSFSYVLTNFVLVLVYFLLLLSYRMHMYRFVLKLAGEARRQKIAGVVRGATLVSQQYLVGLSKMIFCLWIMYGIGFTILGVKNPIFFAIVCGLLEIVPFIGNITGTTITVFVAAAQGASLPVLGGIVITYGTVPFIQGWILEPLILGHEVKINPLFTIIALVLGELLWGIPGVFLAIPLAAIFKAVCDQIESLQPYAFLIGEVEGENKAVKSG